MDIFSHKRPKRPPPTWLKWSILGFILFAALNAYRAEQSDDESALRLKNYPKADQFISKNYWQPVINPHPDETSQELETYGPYRETPQSDQTLTNDGGDSESR